MKTVNKRQLAAGCALFRGIGISYGSQSGAATWGPLPEWTPPPGGVTRKQAQVIIRMAWALWGDTYKLSKTLGVGTETVKEYITNEAAIPKHIGRTAVHLLGRLKESVTPEQLRAARDAAVRSAPKVEPPAIRQAAEEIQSVYEINQEAKSKAGMALAKARMERGLTTVEVQAAVGMQSGGELIGYEHNGITPMSGYYHPLCRYYRLDPTSFGFVGGWGIRARPENAPDPQARKHRCKECARFAWIPHTTQGKCPLMRKVYGLQGACDKFEDKEEERDA